MTLGAVALLLVPLAAVTPPRRGPLDARIVRVLAEVQAECSDVEPHGCSEWGRRYELGIGVKADHEISLALYQVGCAGGDGLSCLVLGWRHWAGDGVGRDVPMSVSLNVQACDLGIAVGCLNAATTLEQSAPPVRDLSRAAELFEKACNAQSGLGCLRFAQLLEHQHLTDDVRPRYLRARACQLGRKDACERRSERESEQAPRPKRP
ncbi:MAG: sel1 repeat family protein [Deltaproteobacteria bacterium]|nr:sel1 repeat family protein [Deltaproteobacteria bacterium]